MMRKNHVFFIDHFRKEKVNSVSLLGVLIMALMIVTGAYNKAFAFAPLEQCPAFTDKTNTVLKESAQSAFEAGDLIALESYFALMQCRMGRPHAKGRETYILVHKVPDLKIRPAKIQKIISDVQEKQVAQKQNTKDAPVSDLKQEMRIATDRMQAAIWSARKSSEEKADTFVEKAKGSAEKILKLKKQSPEEFNSRDENISNASKVFQIEIALALIDFYQLGGDVSYLNVAQNLAKELKARDKSLDFLQNAALGALRARVAAETPNGNDGFNNISHEIRLGVLSGLYGSGPHKGHFLTPEAEHLSVRYQIAAFLIQAYEAFPPDHPERATLKEGADYILQGIFGQLASKNGTQITAESAALVCELESAGFDKNRIWGDEASRLSYQATRNILYLAAFSGQDLFKNRLYERLCLLGHMHEYLENK